MQVIVVDVEDRDDSVWHNLTPLDGGLSGWRLLWDRWCPIPSFRCPLACPDFAPAWSIQAPPAMPCLFKGKQHDLTIV